MRRIIMLALVACILSPTVALATTRPYPNWRRYCRSCHSRRVLRDALREQVTRR